MSRTNFWPTIGLITCLSTGWMMAQTGPMVGTVKQDRAWFLYRPGAVEKTLRLSVLNAAGQVVGSNEASSSADNDYVAKFNVGGLQAGTSYTYRIEDVTNGEIVPVLGPQDGLKFATPLALGKRGVVTAAFASCANASSEPVWQRIGMLGVDQVFLMGDTPYVDVSDLPTIRNKHRSFLETPFLSALIRRTPIAGTWDDHDFGLNNGNGVNAADRKVNTRRGFVEYRAHEQFGDGEGGGVYHKIDRGVMEVFLLDPRWFSQTGPSPVDPNQKTCFGEAQMLWLREALKASRAPFKVLASGGIWQDKKNGETDDMFTYWYERDVLLDFIRDEKISGVVLLSGDIHVSRHLIHPQRLGYDLHDFITSPAHTSVIPSLDVPHPSLEWSAQQARQFLTLTADTQSNPPKLTARYLSHDGSLLREVVVPYDQLAPKEGNDLGRGLRAWWPFDGDMKNKSVLGSRIDATAVNGASLVEAGGLRGGAATFNRGQNQYLHIGRSMLDDNSAGHTVSLWCKPASLPAHGSGDRHFLMESTLDGNVGNGNGYGISAGFRAAEDVEKVNLELHTYTLVPAASVNAAPSAVARGGYSCLLDRSLFNDTWNHVTITADLNGLRLFLNGEEVAYHEFPIAGPVSEMGGLVIGGHRQGTGRNFNGLLDEIAVWQRVLNQDEILSLHNAGTPPSLPVEVSALDSDGDTLEDWWEVLHGLDPDDPADALADADGDGVPVWLERAAGTHPLVDNSVMFDYLRDRFDPEGSDQPFVFRHPSTNSLSLMISGTMSEDLADWDDEMSSSQVSGTIQDNEFQFVIPASSSPKRFFRFEAEP